MSLIVSLTLVKFRVESMYGLLYNVQIIITVQCTDYTLLLRYNIEGNVERPKDRTNILLILN